MTLEIVIALALVLVAGLVIGWLIGGRAAAVVRADLAAATVRADQADALRKTLAEAEQERELAGARFASLQIDKAALEADHAARTEGFEAQLKQLREAKEALGQQFEAVGAKLLDAAQTKFLERADARFKQSEETAGQGLKALLQPVHERLQKYEETVGKVEAERRDAFGDLKGQIEAMRVGQESVKTEATRIVAALRAAPKSHGRWAEQQFRNMIELAGLKDKVDFQEQVSVLTETGRLRPDFIMRLPEGKLLVVDIKCSLESYMQGVDELDPVKKLEHFKRHAKSLRTHAELLAKKDYCAQFDEAPDFVIMYIHGDNFITAAMESDFKLWEDAARDRVIICGPSMFLPMARTVSSVWKQESLAKDHRRIVDLGRGIHDRLVTAADSLRTMGGGLQTAVTHYNAFVGTFETAIAREGRRFKSEFNVDAAKAITEVQSVEKVLRETRLVEGPEAN